MIIIVIIEYNAEKKCMKDVKDEMLKEKDFSKKAGRCSKQCWGCIK